MSNYPASLDTDSDLYVVADLALGILNVTMTAAATTIQLSGGVGAYFPISGGLVRIDDGNDNNIEIVSYTGVAGDNLTGVTRGLDPRYPASTHPAGSRAFLTVAANHHNAHTDAIKAIQSELGLLPSAAYASVRARIDGLNTEDYVWSGDHDFTGSVEMDTLDELTPSAGVTIDGALIKDGNYIQPVTEVAANHNAAQTDYYIGVDASAATRTITLPPLGRTGKTFVIKKTDSSSNPVVVEGGGSDSVDGALSFSLGNQYEAVTVIDTTTQWSVI